MRNPNQNRAYVLLNAFVAPAKDENDQRRQAQLAELAVNLGFVEPAMLLSFAVRRNWDFIFTHFACLTAHENPNPNTSQGEMKALIAAAIFYLGEREMYLAIKYMARHALVAFRAGEDPPAWLQRAAWQMYCSLRAQAAVLAVENGSAAA